MKQVVFFFFLLLTISHLQAQDSIAVNLVNQYKKHLKSKPVRINNIDYTTDKTGHVTIRKPLSDSITITSPGYDEETIAFAETDTQKQVVVNKHFSWTDLLTPMFYILYGGIWLLILIIFAETGLFIGFFFPGDSLLFVAGILSTSLVDSISLNTGNDFFNLMIITALCSIAGILGNTVGYITGRKVGPAMFNWRDRWLFKKRYLYQAQAFYDKHGGGAIVFARFLPLVRTFAPIVAGIVGMDKKKFGFYNIIGCIAWVTSMLFIGHYLNAFTKKQFGIDLEEHLEVIVIAIVLVTTAPVLFKMFFGKKKKADEHIL
ncbi:MAG: VTT domain-containing protein [Chitinophagaceae bacterium]|nr:VTT domain-containing protein [Chitinophagaceae bacterium]